MQRPNHGGNLIWAAALANCHPNQILDFSASINPLGPPTSALEILASSSELLRHYPDPECTELKTALAQNHQISPDWILPGNGAAELLTWVGRDFQEHNLSCNILVPGFNDYFRALNAYKVRINPITIALLEQEELNPEIYSQDSRNSGCIINNPHNPSGKRVSQKYIEECIKHYPLVVIDEAFLDFLHPTDQHSSIALIEQYPNLVILRSLTKFFSLPGLRIGYAIAHPDRLKQWQQWRDPWSVNSLAIAMGAECVRDVSFQEQVWDWLPKTRSHLYQQLQHISFLTPIPGIANFLLVKSARSVTHIQSELLQKHKILIRDCLSFPELGDHYFRVAVLSQAQNERLVQALSQMNA